MIFDCFSRFLFWRAMLLFHFGTSRKRWKTGNSARLEEKCLEKISLIFCSTSTRLRKRNEIMEEIRKTASWEKKISLNITSGISFLYWSITFGVCVPLAYWKFTPTRTLVLFVEKRRNATRRGRSEERVNYVGINFYISFVRAYKVRLNQTRMFVYAFGEQG